MADQSLIVPHVTRSKIYLIVGEADVYIFVAIFYSVRSSN